MNKPQQRDVTLRRSPKYGAWAITGLIIGVIAATLLTLIAPNSGAKHSSVTESFSREQVFGFLLLICTVVGVALAITTALIIDQILHRHHKIAVVNVLHDSNPTNTKAEPR